VGLADIMVVLYRGNGVSVDTGFTDENGIYLFNNLTQGIYFAKFFVSNPYYFTLMDQGDDEAKDSDASEGSGGTTPSISLAHGAKFYDLDAGVFFSTINSELKTTANQTKAETLKLEVRPNPAINDLIVNLPYKNSTVTIYDQNGKTIQSFESSEHLIMIDLRNYNAGQYFLHCISGKEEQVTKFYKAD
ncbi:MAG: hypothetical protein RLZZ546_479, partial [Bacteroidota bacterium]